MLRRTVALLTGNWLRKRRRSAKSETSPRRRRRTRCSWDPKSAQTTKLEEIFNFTERARSIPTFSDICFTKRDTHDVMSMAYGTRLCQQFFAQIAPLSFPHTLLLSGRMLKASPPKYVFFPLPLSSSNQTKCTQRLVEVVLRCQNQDALRSALWRPATPQHPQGLKTSTVHPQRVPPYDRRCARLCAQAVGVACLVP